MMVKRWRTYRETLGETVNIVIALILYTGIQKMFCYWQATYLSPGATLDIID